MKPAKIGKGYAIGLMVVAGFFDLLSLIPGVSVVIGVIGQIVIAGLFWVKGVNVFKDKALITYVLSGLIEILPQSGFLPFFLIETGAIIALSWAKKA